MPGRRMPWWVYPIAGAYLGYFVLLAWSALAGPADPGFLLSFDRGRAVVRSVRAGTAAARAGFHAGDRIFTAGALRVSARLDWRAVAAGWRAGRPERFTIERGVEIAELTLTPESRSLADWKSPGAAVAVVLWLFRLTTLLLAFLVAWRGWAYTAARVGAWFLASSAVCTVAVVNGFGAELRSLPPVAAALLSVPALCSFQLGAIFFTFFSVFPRPAIRSTCVLAAAWLPGLAHVPWLGAFFYSAAYRPELGAGIARPWMITAFAFTFAGYVLAGVGALWFTYRRTSEVAQRRRIRLLALGATVGWAAAAPLVIADWRGSVPSLSPAFFSEPVAIAAGAVFLACMFALVYALLRRRVFGIGVILRQGLRYALARRTVMSLAPAALLVLAVDILLHGDETVMSILSARGWVYGLLAALFLLAQSRRQRWLDAIDRRFFRERYDAQRLLRGVVEEARRAASIREVATRSVALIEAALHPEYVALLSRRNDDPEYGAIAAAPAGDGGPALRAGNKVTALARMLEKPLEIPHSTGSWLEEQLPPADIDAVRQARIEILIPVFHGGDGGEAFLVLGRKRSEEPYASEDRELLSTVAGSLGLLFERDERAHVSAATGPQNLQECPSCGGCYDSGVVSCPREGSMLAPRRIPRVLAARYRIDRRLGSGGMGTVYAATDLALDRAVAAKVIHDEMVGSPEAAERFRREARAAASFCHPNIVTVHDFGVFSESHAFLIMELLRGTTLREALRAARRMEPSRALEILRGVCDAIEAAHRREIIHRDLKPENIFLASTESGEVPKVLDFGLAKSLRAFAATTTATQTAVQTESGVLVGTLHYMPPEQLLGEVPQPSWDLWAVSVVAYEMLAGTYPFAQATRGEWREAVLAGAVTPIKFHLPQAPAALDRFFSRAFSTNRDERPHSPRRFYDELDRALA